MIGTNLTFFGMLILGYMGMPRRYATYDSVTVGPIDAYTILHQSATVGAFILLLGQLIFVWNVVSSWKEGRQITDGDPWNLKEDDLYSREFRWFERRMDDDIALADGGEESPDGDSERQ
jgi:cytochrome c oxidase subunit 1